MYEKLHSGEEYLPFVPELFKEQLKVLKTLKKFNSTSPANVKKKAKLLKKMLAEMGENCYVETPFYSSWAGKHVHFGNSVYANFNLTLIDDTHIYIGDNTLIGPNVTIATALHPLDAEKRRLGYQSNKPVVIGKNCWICSGALILPGVTIGDNTVIGAGAVVTKDIPSNVLAVGNPAKVIKNL
mgnify:CR=1 FL=1